MKEHWEPTLEDLYDIVSRDDNLNSKVSIREAWSIEASNHGDSAVLNEQTLLWGYTPVCTSRLSFVKHQQCYTD